MCFRTKAAKFASRELHANIEKARGLGVSLEESLRSAFLWTHEEFQSLMIPAGMSGTTATIAMVFPDQLAVANVGDSRAIICCDEHGSPIQLTVDHTASKPEERERLKGLGARVLQRGVWRLEGELALSRSIGDLPYDRFLSREPHITTRKLGGSQEFMVLASDGLWDVMSNEEVVEFVRKKMKQLCGPFSWCTTHGEKGRSCSSSGNGQEQEFEVDYYALAEALTWEAYVRGSTDNIGVCVVDLRLTDQKLA